MSSEFHILENGDEVEAKLQIAISAQARPLHILENGDEVEVFTTGPTPKPELDEVEATVSLLVSSSEKVAYPQMGTKLKLSSVTGGFLFQSCILENGNVRRIVFVFPLQLRLS